MAASDEVARSAQVLPEALNDTAGLKASTEQFQRQMVIQALEQAQGNWAAACLCVEVIGVFALATGGEHEIMG